MCGVLGVREDGILRRGHLCTLQEGAGNTHQKTIRVLSCTMGFPGDPARVLPGIDEVNRLRSRLRGKVASSGGLPRGYPFVVK